MDTTFGTISFKRNYYKDRQTQQYVYLLDQYLEFEGTKGFSPMIEGMAMEMAVNGTSYRHASAMLEKLLGYSVMSHEAIRQHLLQTEVDFKRTKNLEKRVLFIEVDGLYIKRQSQKRKGKEVKIAAVHEGWRVNGKRTSLINKRHDVHRGKEPFWEGFEQFLMDNYNYDPQYHLLVINGDGANWITACQDYFQKNIFYVLDRFHVARNIRRICKGHKRYRFIQKKLAYYDVQGLMAELNSVVGTLDEEAKEEQLDQLIKYLSKHIKALQDYRVWLRKKGVDTDDMRPMGSAEGTMSVFAKRLKNGRSWCDKGIVAFVDFMIGLKDELTIKTILGKINDRTSKKMDYKQPRHYVEKLTSSIGEATRNNIAYLTQSKGKPIYSALKALKGF